jgi:hypothetical protein
MHPFNDENLLEIRDSRIAAIYVAEFLRLYEHYRARAIAIAEQVKGMHERLVLQPNSDCAKKYFIDGSPEAQGPHRPGARRQLTMRR